MSKRGADRQITKDDPEEDVAAQGEENMEEGGTWRAASTAQLAGRVIVKARRKGISAPTGVAMPAFNFGAPAATTPAATAAPAAVTADTVAPTTADAPLNALQRLAAAQAATTWPCPTCDTNNKLADTICGACEQPNPNAPAASTSAAAASSPAPVSGFTFGSAPVAAATPAAPAAEAPVENALTRLAAKQAAETWECATCTTNNKLSATVCGACDEPRAGSTNGAADASATTAAPAPVGFSFGAPASSSAAATPAAATPAAAPLFSFGAGEASASPATFGSVPSFSFGGSLIGAAPVSFGSVASSTAAAFGSADATPQFEASSAEALQSANSELNTQFLNKSKESTGEENDEVHYKVLTKVFQLKKVPIVKIAPELQHGPTGEVTAAAAAAGTSSPAAAAAAAAAPVETPAASDEPVRTETKYVEIGTGELHVNSVVDPATGKTRARMVLREAQTKRSVLNAPMFANMVYQLQNDKYVRFHSLDLEGAMSTFTLKFKEKTQAQDVIRAIDTCMALIK